MPAYLIALIEIHDPVAYREYHPLAAEAIRQAGGRVLAGGGELRLLENFAAGTRAVIVEFDDLAAGERFYASPAYRAAMERRRGAATVRMALLEGG